MVRMDYSLVGRRQWNAENPGALHPLDVTARLAEFKEMQDGWADGMQHAKDWGKGYGKAPNPAGLDWLARAFEINYPDDLPLPYIYPTPEGGIEVEWSLGPFEISLEVNLETRTGEWHWVEILTDADAEELLDLADSGHWDWMAAEIRRLAQAVE